MKPLKLPALAPLKAPKAAKLIAPTVKAVKPALAVPPKPSRPTGAARTSSIPHPGEGYSMNFHTSKTR